MDLLETGRRPPPTKTPQPPPRFRSLVRWAVALVAAALFLSTLGWLIDDQAKAHDQTGRAQAALTITRQKKAHVAQDLAKLRHDVEVLVTQVGSDNTAFAQDAVATQSGAVRLGHHAGRRDATEFEDHGAPHLPGWSRTSTQCIGRREPTQRDQRIELSGRRAARRRPVTERRHRSGGAGGEFLVVTCSVPVSWWRPSGPTSMRGHGSGTRMPRWRPQTHKLASLRHQVAATELARFATADETQRTRVLHCGHARSTGEYQLNPQFDETNCLPAGRQHRHPRDLPRRSPERPERHRQWEQRQGGERHLGRLRRLHPTGRRLQFRVGLSLRLPGSGRHPGRPDVLRLRDELGRRQHPDHRFDRPRALDRHRQRPAPSSILGGHRVHLGTIGDTDRWALRHVLHGGHSRKLLQNVFQ